VPSVNSTPTAHGQSSQSPIVSVVIPTFRRNAGLTSALQRVMSQKVNINYEIIVVDNSPEGGACLVMESFVTQAARPILYVQEPRAGIANARNSGVRAASGEFIAFLDDDETAEPEWLEALYNTAIKQSADVVFGPIIARLPPDTRKHKDYFKRFFSRFGPKRETVIAHFYGCGNSLIRRHAFPDPPFESKNFGEDSQLFSVLEENGAKFAWSPGAEVYEHVCSKRVRLQYTLKRAFAYGQGPSQICMWASPPKIGECFGWMVLGASQVLVFGTLTAIAWSVFLPARAELLDRTMQGLGKVLWMEFFRPDIYGRATTVRSDARTS
jgi:succinoglycan biosynthesis protein ExoM